MKNTIWILTSFSNALYDQPENNLIAWWREKPTLDQVCDAMGMGVFPPEGDECALAVVNVWSGGARVADDTYNLREIKEGPL